MAKKPVCHDLKVSDYNIKIEKDYRGNISYIFYEKYNNTAIQDKDYCVIFYVEIYSYFIKKDEAPNYVNLYKSSNLTGSSFNPKEGYTCVSVYKVYVVKSDNISDIVENTCLVENDWHIKYSNLERCQKPKYYIRGHKVSKNEFDKEYENKRIKTFSIIKRLGIEKNIIDILQIKEYKSYIKINNPILYSEYYEELEKAILDNENKYEIKTLFHGTNHNNALSILTSGFHSSKDGALGPGVYAGLIDKAKAFAACRKSNYEHQNLVVLEIEVLFKNLLTLNDSYVASKHSKFDIEYDGFQRKEWVIRNAHRVLLKKIHYL